MKNTDAAILALACGASIEKAAQQAGVSKRTLLRRLQQPEFQALVQAARLDISRRSSATLGAANSEAIRVLIDLLKTDSPVVRAHAAKAILQANLRYSEKFDIEERLASLERRSVEGPPG